MKVAVTSDTHNRSFSIPKCDLFLHCGDVSGSGSLAEIAKFSQILRDQRGQYKRAIVVPGNHDKAFAESLSWCRETLADVATVLVDELYVYKYTCGVTNAQPFTPTIVLPSHAEVVQQVKIWGSPWTPRFGGWDFMLERGDAIKRKTDLIPEGLDILITHGPPYGILDIPGGYMLNGAGPSRVGCWDLWHRVCQQLESPPRYHVFGHIHGSGESVEVRGKTTFINAAFVDESYMPTHKVMEFEI